MINVYRSEGERGADYPNKNNRQMQKETTWPRVEKKNWVQCGKEPNWGKCPLHWGTNLDHITRWGTKHWLNTLQIPNCHHCWKKRLWELTETTEEGHTCLPVLPHSWQHTHSRAAKISGSQNGWKVTGIRGRPTAVLHDLRRQAQPRMVDAYGTLDASIISIRRRTQDWDEKSVSGDKGRWPGISFVTW